MKPEAILARYFSEEALTMVLTHGKVVAELAVAVGDHLNVPGEERTFLYEAGLLHDIGVCRVHAPGIGLHGPDPYITHGLHGCDILMAEGLPRHALVCERHIGVGLTCDDIDAQHLPLPRRDMVPRTLAEEIICFADLFYSKHPERLTRRKSPEVVRAGLERFGKSKVQIFDRWLDRFGSALEGES